MLAKQPSARLSVYAVWFNMMPSDERVQWPSKLLTDARVTHFWDDQRLLGKWYGTLGGFSKTAGDVVWDAFFVYNSASRWTDRPSGLVGWGSTIIGHKNQLEQVVASALGS